MKHELPDQLNWGEACSEPGAVPCLCTQMCKSGCVLLTEITLPLAPMCSTPTALCLHLCRLFRSCLSTRKARGWSKTTLLITVLPAVCAVTTSGAFELLFEYCELLQLFPLAVIDIDRLAPLCKSPSLAQMRVYKYWPVLQEKSDGEIHPENPHIISVLFKALSSLVGSCWRL